MAGAHRVWGSMACQKQSPWPGLGSATTLSSSRISCVSSSAPDPCWNADRNLQAQVSAGLGASVGYERRGCGGPRSFVAAACLMRCAALNCEEVRTLQPRTTHTLATSHAARSKHANTQQMQAGLRNNVLWSGQYQTALNKLLRTAAMVTRPFGPLNK